MCQTNTADRQLVRALARLRLSISCLRMAMRQSRLGIIISARRHVDGSAQLYRIAADKAPNDIRNSLLKVRGVSALIEAKQLCEETSQGLRLFMEIV